jgi:DNA-directed RNA polymerase beta' subunit
MTGWIERTYKVRPGSCSLVACRYDGTVRNATGSVIQFLYGEDGMDGTAIESQKLDNLRMKDTQFDVRWPFLIAMF